jgi:hypothetical protein
MKIDNLLFTSPRVTRMIEPRVSVHDSIVQADRRQVALNEWPGRTILAEGRVVVSVFYLNQGPAYQIVSSRSGEAITPHGAVNLYN